MLNPARKGRRHPRTRCTCEFVCANLYEERDLAIVPNLKAHLRALFISESGFQGLARPRIELSAGRNTLHTHYSFIYLLLPPSLQRDWPLSPGSPALGNVLIPEAAA